MEPIGRRVDVELLEDEELALRYVCRVLVENSEPVSCDLRLSSSFLRASSGSPSHLLFTLGTWSGSFWIETLDKLAAVARPPFDAAIFFCCSAYWSNAEVEGSLSVRKPRTPFFFLLPALLLCACCGCFPCDDPLLRAFASIWLGLERCDASLMPRSRPGEVVRVLECDDVVLSEALLLPPLAPALLRTASWGTRTGVAALVWVDIIGIGAQFHGRATRGRGTPRWRAAVNPAKTQQVGRHRGVQKSGTTAAGRVLCKGWPSGVRSVKTGGKQDWQTERSSSRQACGDSAREARAADRAER